MKIVETILFLNILCHCAERTMEYDIVNTLPSAVFQIIFFNDLNQSFNFKTLLKRRLQYVYVLMKNFIDFTPSYYCCRVERIQGTTSCRGLENFGRIVCRRVFCPLVSIFLSIGSRKLLS